MIAKMLYTIRQWRINRLERVIAKLKRRNRANWNKRKAKLGVMATRVRPPVPGFLRK